MMSGFVFNILFLAFTIGSINGQIPQISPQLPFLSGGVIVVGQYKGSIDVELPYYKNYTSFNVTLTIPSTNFINHFTFSHTNKGTLLTKVGSKNEVAPLLISGISDTNCQNKLNTKNIGAVMLKANATEERIEIKNFEVSYKLNSDRRLEFKASWDGIKSAKDYIVTWRRIEDCLPNESSMVTDKTVITLKNGFKLDQLKNNYIFNVRVNNNTQNSTSDNKPKAKAIIVPIIVKSLEIKVIKREVNSVKMNMALDFGVTFALNSTHHISFPGAGDYDILYLSANTSYEFFPQVTSKDFGKMIYMQKITFKTAAKVLPVEVVCKDSKSIKLEWDSSSPSDSYIVNYEKQSSGKFNKRIQTSEKTTDVAFCLEANTTYLVTIEIESKLVNNVYGNSKPFNVTTGSNETDTSCYKMKADQTCSGEVSKASITKMSFVIQMMSVIISSILIFKQY